MIDKSDIIILDEILDKLLSFNSRISFNNFKLNNHFENLNLQEKEKEFERLVDYFEKYNCADSYKDGYHKYLKLNQNTKKFKENGGFNNQYEIELSNKIKQDKKENIEKNLNELQKKNLELQNENLEYSITLRAQDQHIRDLEEKIKVIELLKQYWWLLLTCIGIGIYIGKLLDI